MNILTYEMVLTVCGEYMKFRNYAKSSIQVVALTLRFFNEYMTKQKKEKDYREVDEGDFYAFLEYWEKRSVGIKKETLNGYGMNLKRAFAILEEEEKIMQNPFSEIETVKISRTIRDKIFTVKEMEEILNSIDTTSPMGFRDRTIFETLYGTGIRARELANLDLADFLKEDKMIFIRNGKGKKDRIVPLGNTAFNYITEWIKAHRPKYVRRSMEKRSHIKHLFLNSYGGPVNQDVLKSIIRRIKDNMPPEKGVDITKLCAHVLRHTYATHLIEAGADIREVQLLLGHKSIDATEIYLNFTTAHLKDVYEKFHPLENELFFDAVARESYILDWKKETKTGKKIEKKRIKT
jgi:integrase/recombinase XerD